MGGGKKKARVTRITPIFIAKQVSEEVRWKVVRIPRDVGERRNIIVLGVKMMTVL